MPIRRAEFDRGEIDPSLSILEFFKSQPHLAFTAEEVQDALERADRVTDIEIVRQMLLHLESRGRLESRVVSGRLYYAYKAITLGR
jgi:hypothetical protein